MGLKPTNQGPGIAGRDAEMRILEDALSSAAEGHGQTMLVLGEAGIGKSRLVEEFISAAAAGGVRLLSGRAGEGDVRPFGLFSDALETLAGGELFGEEEHVGFGRVFLMDGAGELIGKSVAEGEGVDAETFAGMLSAVQSFVSDSFGSGGEANAGLGKLVYGDRTVFIEHGAGLYLAAVTSGAEHPRMRDVINAATRKLEESAARGDSQTELDRLAGTKFMVKKSLEGVKFENERLRIAEHVSMALSAAAEETPILLLGEDLHWADDSSLFLFTYLARNIGSDSVLMVGTARPEGGPEFGKFRESLWDEGTAAELALGGLDEHGVRAMLDSMFRPNELPDEFCRRLTEDSKGNPLFIGETLRQMADDASIIFEHGAHVLARDDYNLPKSAEEVVSRRLDGLDPEAMAVAEYASCIGVTAGMEAILSMNAIEDTGAALERLGRSGVLVLTDTSASFSHAIFREVTYRSISQRWKAKYHRSLGEHYERICGPEPGDLIYELARHFSASGDSGKAHEYSLSAGERADQSYAPELARQFYASALDNMPRGLEKADAAPILEKLADSEKSLGLLAESRANYEKALGMLDVGGKSYLRLILKLNSLLTTLHDGAGAASLLDSAMPYADSAEPEIECRMLARSSLLRAAEGKEWYSLSAQALERLAAVSDIGIRVEVYTTLSRAYDVGDNIDKARQLLETAVAEAERGGDMRAIAQAYSVIGEYLHYRGQPGTASKLVEKAAAYLERLGDIGALTGVTALLGMTYSDSGELEKSLACLKRALAATRRIGVRQGTATMLGNIGYTLAMMGRHEESLEYQRESFELRKKAGSKGGMGWSYYDMSMVHGQVGDVDKALECLGNASELLAEAGDFVGLICVKTAQANYLAEKGDAARAEALYREILELAEKKDMALDRFQALMGLADLGAIALEDALPEMAGIERRLGALSVSMALNCFRGRKAAEAGNLAEAEVHFEAGLSLAVGATGADAELGKAEILLERARARLEAGNRDGAGDDAAEANRLFMKWGRLSDARKASSLGNDQTPKI